MDQASICSTSDMSEGILSYDSIQRARMGRQTQDALLEGRIGSCEQSTSSAKLSSPRFAMGAPIDLTFPRPSKSSAVRSSCGAPCSPSPVSTCNSVSSYSSKRRVNFSHQRVTINEQHNQETITDEDMRVRWWTQADLDEIKHAAKEMSLRLRKLAKERGCHVETAHKKTSLMLTNNFQELVKLSASSPDQDLRHWCARSDGRRGLERFACREYGNMRKDDVADTRAAVFQEQERQRAKCETASPEAIAKVSKEKSRRSRTFSLFMGEADAQAAARGVARTTSNKRCKVTHSSPNANTNTPPQQTQGNHVRGFPVDAPLLKSAA